jgi:hydroxymethylbilane synthase
MRVGTRGSALALAQASWVAERLQAALGEEKRVELVTITTLGDRGEAVGDKSRWVSALEQALIDGRIDIAVHSAKDVPADVAEGLALVAFPSREDARDAICGAPSLQALRSGARIGTSSLRRAAQIRAARDDVQVVPVRGNVDTRLRKLHDGEFDAIVLAAAGLRRLERDAEAGGLLDDLIPAPGQGALAIEARSELAAELADELAPLQDAETAACVSAERELVHALEASCDTPVGAHARLLGGDQIELRAWAGLPDGSEWIADRILGAPADGLGRALAERMLSVGAGELLRRAATMA